jgi:hypothetical protein
MIQVMQRHERGEARVIPVLLRPALWQETLFGKLQALPANGNPITGGGWQNADEPYVEIAKGIQRVLAELSLQRFVQQQAAPPLQEQFPPSQEIPTEDVAYPMSPLEPEVPSARAASRIHTPSLTVFLVHSH